MAVIIVTGTPGTGKTHIAELISRELRFTYIDVNKLIEENDLCDEYDEQRQCRIVDADRVKEAILKKIAKGNYVIDSHLSQYLPPKKVDLCIVTKCELGTLKQRLERRGYSAEKVRENMDAEIFDNCLTEAEEIGHKVLIIDTTHMDDEEVIEKIREKLK